MKELRAFLKYEGAIRVHIEPHLGFILADVLNRDQVRASVKKIMVRVPRGSAPKDRPRGGKEAARSVIAVLRKMMNWGIRERLLKRTDNPLTGWKTICRKRSAKRACCRSRRRGSCGKRRRLSVTRSDRRIS
jgi:hypothetical protein